MLTVVQGLLSEDARRALLHEMDQAIIGARADLGDAHRSVVGMTGAYHNLLRMWAEV